MTRLDDRMIAFICRHVVDVKDWTVGQAAYQEGMNGRPDNDALGPP